MSLFYAIFFGILGIIIIARLASKTMPREREFTETESLPGHTYKKSVEAASKRSHDVFYLESLVSLLVKKGIITEEELLKEISRTDNTKDMD